MIYFNIYLWCSYFYFKGSVSKNMFTFQGSLKRSAEVSVYLLKVITYGTQKPLQFSNALAQFCAADVYSQVM